MFAITETAPKPNAKPPINPHSKIDFSVGDIKKNVCPFAAHIRKLDPRDDRDQHNRNHTTMRRGIQFGDELRPGETKNSDFLDQGKVFLDYKKEENFRGLLFACYQSNIGKGFYFLQTGEFR